MVFETRFFLFILIIVELNFLPHDAMLSTVYAVVVCLCVCVLVCLSVCHLRYRIKTAKRRIMQIMPHDSPGTLVF